MKNASIFHCTDGAPDMFWYPWMKAQLEQKGYTVWVPDLPNPAEPRIEQWLPFALENGTYDEDTVLIGHSAGCPLILSILEKIEVKIKQAILVAAFSDQLSDGDPEPILQPSYVWESIRAHVTDITFINSDNDPWGCDVPAGQKLLENIGGTLIIPHGQGHMGSTSYNQPYLEFPLLSKLVE